MDKLIVINRIEDNGTQTIGLAMLLNGQFKTLLDFVVLELAWNDNKRSKSCVKAGQYKVAVRTSPKYGRHLHVTNVYGRTFILFHWGNFYRDTKGCILVGDRFVHIDGDGFIDINLSKKTFDSLMSFIEDDDIIELVINPAIYKT